MKDTLINRVAAGVRLDIPRTEIIAMLKGEGLNDRDAHFAYMEGCEKVKKATTPEPESHLHTWEDEGGNHNYGAL